MILVLTDCVESGEGVICSRQETIEDMLLSLSTNLPIFVCHTVEKILFQVINTI